MGRFLLRLNQCLWSRASLKRHSWCSLPYSCLLITRRRDDSAAAADMARYGNDELLASPETAGALLSTQ
jgi:hypothetical protein